MQSLGVVRTQTVSTDEELDAKLAAIDRRREVERTAIRAALKDAPTHLALAEAARETFGAKLAYLHVRVSDFKRGTDIPPGIRPSPPADAFVDKRRKKKP